MKLFLRELFVLAVAGVLTWWVVFRLETPATVLAEPPMPQPLSVALTPLADIPVQVAAAPPAAAPQPDPPAPAQAEEPAPAEPEEQPDEAPEEEEAPPPAELGAPEGEGEDATSVEDEPEEPEESAAEESVDEEPAAEEPAEDGARSAEELMTDDALLSDARAEVSGEAKRGFATVLLASPEEQLEIARFFGETLVLVPRANLDPEAESPTYFSVEADGHEHVEVVTGRAPLEGLRQYRDLFDYEYARLPDALRELRRSVFARNEIFLFAALIPVEEWAVIVGRRREALEQSGREISDVRRFVLRYVQRPQQGFDLRVEEILFVDEERFHPPRESQPKGS